MVLGLGEPRSAKCKGLREREAWRDDRMKKVVHRKESRD
jgi:hypothetical protein